MQLISSLPRLLLVGTIVILLASTLSISNMLLSIGRARAESVVTPVVTSVPYQVIDAEYSKTLDRIITVSASPNQLHIYNPVTLTSVDVGLPRAPFAVSVGPDGHYAAVGHDALVSYVDLQNGKLIKTLDLTAEAADLVLAGNGKIYVSPVRDQWVNLHVIDIATNTEVLGNGIIRADTRYKLHPDGTSLYGADRGLSPSQIHKIDITVQPPANLYDGPYWGDYDICGDLWMSEDGRRVFTACGNVFRASTVRGQDMAYNGSLAAAGISGLRHLTHSQAANKVLAIPSTADTQVVLVDYEQLTLDRKVTLPSFVVGSTTYAAHGRFVFANAAGTSIFTIVQADSSSGLLNDYGIVTLPMVAPAATATPITATTPTTAQPDQTPTATVTPITATTPMTPTQSDQKPTADSSTNTPTITPLAQQGGVTSLPYQVVDAEYSKALDRVIMVSANPNQLHIYNPVIHTSVDVGLPRAPFAVSVGPDGHYAAVGHDALISYVDLQSGTLVKTLDLSAEASDIVLADNGKVYVSPVRDQWVNLHAIDIATNTEVLGSGIIRAATRYKLHPDGTSLYGADVGLSPSQIHKIDITVHPPANLYDSPYFGDYAMCGNLWMSEDGLRIFTACGNVFRASAVRGQDMTYNGSLAATGLNAIRHLTHSQAANEVLAIPFDTNAFTGRTTTVDTQVVLAHYENLTLDRKVTLPSFVVGSTTYAAHGRFVFANAAGTSFYTIVQADPSAGLLNDYGIVTASMQGVVEPIPTATATPIQAPSPTITVTPAQTPSSTTVATPVSENGPIFESNFTTGAPGSVFVLTASGFPQNARATIAIRRPDQADYQDVVTLSLDSAGQLVFALVTSPNDPPGVYWVRVTVVSQGQSLTTSTLVHEQAIVLSEQEQHHDSPPNEGVPEVSTSNVRKVFIPIVHS